MAIYHDLDNTGQEVQQRLDQVPVTQADLAEEVLARQAAVGAVQNNVDAEELRAKAAEKLNADDIDAIEEKIPSGASSSNKMATASDISSLDAAIDAIEEKIPSGASSSNKMATASDISSLNAAIEAILLLIPSAATSLNKLADKAFVNSSIATATATFRGTKNLVSDLNLAVDATHEQIAVALSEAVSGADNNDYAFVQVPTSSGTPTEIRVTERYKFDGTAWSYEYDLNNSGFTSDQWAAINSTITSGLVDKLNALPSNADLTAALGILTNGIAAINEKIPTAATSSNKLVDTAAMQSYITQILDGIDATFNVTSTDGHVTIQVTQVNGVVINVAVTTSDIASAADVAQLFQLYNALSQSEPEIIQPADTWPVANPSTTVIYRVIDRVNTPPQNYSDYMFSASDLTTPVLMATYNNAIDPRPKKGSQNLVTSGGVFDNMGALDVSELNATENPHTPAIYANLSAALAAITSDYQKGGMSIKFVQGSVQSNDNKYIQARCMAPNFTTDVTKWQVVDEEPTAGSRNLVESGGVFESTLHKSIVGEPGDNMITNEVTWTDGYYAKTNSNSDVANNTLSKTSKIQVVAGKTYIFPAYAGSNFETTMFCRVSNAAGIYITESRTPPYFTNISISADNVITLTIPTGGVAIEINFKTADKASCFLKEILTADSKQKIDWLEVDENNLSPELQGKINNPNVSDIQATQIDGNEQVISEENIPLDTFTVGGYARVNSGGAIEIQSNQTIHSAIIECEEGDEYLICNTLDIDPSGSSAPSYYIFGSSSTVAAISNSEIGNYVTVFDATNHVYKVVIPEGCTVFMYTMRDTAVSSSFVKKIITQKELKWLEIKKENINKAFLDELISENTYHLWDSIRKEIEFSGKTIQFFGDSITQGKCSPNLGDAGQYRYSTMFCGYAGATEVNKAISGSCITDSVGGDEYNIGTRIKQYVTESSQIIVIAGGTNDFNTGKQLGTYADTDSVTPDRTTFYGSLQDICNFIKNTAPNAIVIFITPIPYTKPDSAYPNHILPLNAYRSAIYDVATKNGYNVVDGNSLGMPRKQGGWNNFMCADSDGCHPTVEGHKLMARNLCGKLL